MDPQMAKRSPLKRPVRLQGNPATEENRNRGTKNNIDRKKRTTRCADLRHPSKLKTLLLRASASGSQGPASAGHAKRKQFINRHVGLLMVVRWGGGLDRLTDLLPEFMLMWHSCQTGIIWKFGPP